MTTSIFVLIIVYQLKHWIADYPLQGRYMLGKFKPFPEFILPLTAHAAVHAAFTFLIVISMYNGYYLYYAGLEKWIDVPVYEKMLVCLTGLKLGLLDGTIHFIVDRIKASPKLLGRFQPVSKQDMMQILANEEYVKKFPGTLTSHQILSVDRAKLKSNTLFWWALGLDQMAHHLTHYLIIWLLVR